MSYLESHVPERSIFVRSYGSEDDTNELNSKGLQHGDEAVQNHGFVYDSNTAFVGEPPTTTPWYHPNPDLDGSGVADISRIDQYQDSRSSILPTRRSQPCQPCICGCELHNHLCIFAEPLQSDRNPLNIVSAGVEHTTIHVFLQSHRTRTLDYLPKE